MRMQIRHLSGKLPTVERDTMTRLIDSAVSRFESGIDAVEVTLRDTNGPKGGLDQQCQIYVSFKDGKHVQVTEKQAHPLAGVAKAADRVSHLISRHLDRQRDVTRVRLS